MSIHKSEKCFLNDNGNTTRLCVCEDTQPCQILLRLLALRQQSNTSVCSDTALLLCQHVCAKGRGALMRQDYENQSPSPSRKAEAWLSAYRPVLIRLTHCDKGRVWYTTKDKTPSWQLLTATRGSEWLYRCVRMHYYLRCRTWAAGWQFCQCCSLLAERMTWHRSSGHSFP